MHTHAWRRAGLWVAALCALMGPLTAAGATLEAGVAEVTPNCGDVPVTFTLSSLPTEAVAAFQFDLRFDPRAAVLSDMEAGPEALAAGKAVTFHELEPGHVRVIVAGLNQNVMADGVVATALFDIPATPPNGAHPVRIDNLVMSNPGGRAIPADALEGAIIVSGGVPDDGGDDRPGCGCGATGGPARPAAGDAAVLLFGVLLAYGWFWRRAPGSTPSACSRA